MLYIHSMYYAYCRKSTEQQQETSFEVQRDFLIRQANLLNVPYKVLTETGSGSTMADRPVFMRILSDLQPNDILGCYDQSRISRNPSESYIIIDTIQQKKAKLQVNGKFIDPDEPQDMAIFGIQAVFSGYQRSIQLDKSRKGLKQKYLNGDAVFTGNMIGWQLNRYGKATIIDEEAKVIRYIFSEFIRGKSLKQLEKELYGKVLQRPYKFSIENLRDMIQRPIYCGWYFSEPNVAKHVSKYTEDILKSCMVKSNIYPPIIQEDEWWTALRRYRTVRTPHAIEYQFRWSPHILAGVFKCPCGKGISYHHRIRQGNVFETYMFQSHTPNCSYGKHISYPMEWLEDITQACFLFTFLAGNEVGLFFEERKREIEKLTEDVDMELKEIGKEISRENSKKDRLVDAVAEGLLDTASISKQMSKITDNLKALEQRKDRLLEERGLRLADYETFTEISAQDVIDTYTSHFREYLLKYSGGNSVLQSDRSLILSFMNGKEFHIHYPKRTNKRSFPSQVDVSFRGEYQFSFVYFKSEITNVICDNEYMLPALERWKKMINEELNRFGSILL